MTIYQNVLTKFESVFNRFILQICFCGVMVSQSMSVEMATIETNTVICFAIVCNFQKVFVLANDTFSWFLVVSGFGFPFTSVLSNIFPQIMRGDSFHSLYFSFILQPHLFIQNLPFPAYYFSHRIKYGISRITYSLFFSQLRILLFNDLPYFKTGSLLVITYILLYTFDISLIITRNPIKFSSVSIIHNPDDSLKMNNFFLYRPRQNQHHRADFSRVPINTRKTINETANIVNVPFSPPLTLQTSTTEYNSLGQNALEKLKQKATYRARILLIITQYFD